MPIDFTLNEAHRELQQGARAFAEAALTPVRDVVRRHHDPRERFQAIQPFFKQMVSAGFMKSLMPSEVGGGGAGALDFAIAAEELARIDVNVPSALLATGLGLQPLIQFGSPEQKATFLRPFVEDESGMLLASLAFTEVTGGANFDTPDPKYGVRTVARRDGDEWVISGQKHYTTNGTGFDGRGAHIYNVVCRTDLSRSPQESLAHIVIPGDTPGIEIVDVYEQMGQRAVLSPRIHFNDVRVPARNIIGAPGDGIMICSRAFSWTAAIIGAACVGVMRAAFDYALDFARRDHRSGPVPILDHQNVGYMLANMKMKLEAARYLTWKGCHYLDQTEGAGEELAIMAKTHCSELCVEVVYDAMRLVGVDSYLESLPLEALMRDALCFPIYDGGNMGVRRRQLHELFRTEGYDPMAAAEARFPPWLQESLAAAE